ncbi:MAG: hypothetical protein KDB82_14135 [Planctomycetes bacterium]|nr:hypothetical protein [Planctomycetota bacterium]
MAVLIGPVLGGLFFLLGFVLGWRFATALVGGAFVMLGGTLGGWAMIRFSGNKEERE